MTTLHVPSISSVSRRSVIVMHMRPSHGVGHREMSVDQGGGLSFLPHMNPRAAIFFFFCLLVAFLKAGETASFMLFLFHVSVGEVQSFFFVLVFTFPNDGCVHVRAFVYTCARASTSAK